MASKVVVHDSGAVHAFAGQLRRFSAELDATAAAMAAAAHSVRDAWQDPQQQKVEEQCDQIRSALRNFREQAAQVASYCDRVAAQVEAVG